MNRWKKPALWTIAILILLMAFIAFILPGIVKSQAIKGIETATGRKTEISKVSLNPLTWTARVEGFRLMEKNEKTVFVAFGSVSVSISPFSIFRMAPLVSQVRIGSPYLHIVRTAANSYNFSDLLVGKKNKDEKPQRFSLNNIIINNGSVDFIDRALPHEKSHTIRKIEVAVPFISNIKYYADQFVQPRFSAVINGSPFKLEGKLRPFLKGAETASSINLQGLSLPYYLSYYPGQPPVKVDSGRLSTRLDIIHRVREGKDPELEVKGEIILDDIAATDREGAPLVSLGRGETRIGKIEVISREISINSISLDAPEIHLSRDKGGIWNFKRLMGKEEPTATKPETRKPLINVAETSISKGRILMADAFPPGGFKGEVSGITLAMHGFSTAKNKKGNFELSFSTPREESGNIRGEFSMEPLTVDTTADLKEIDLEAYYPYLADQLTKAIKGRLDVFAGINLSPENGPKITKLDMEIRKLLVPFGKDEAAKMDKIRLNGGKASLKERTVEVDGIELLSGNIKLSRDAEGKFSPLALLKGQKGAKPAVKAKKQGETTFKIDLKKFSGSGMNVTFTDRMKEDEPSFPLKRIRFSLSNISLPRFAWIPFDFAAIYGNKGSIGLKGSVIPEPLKAKGECSLKRIPISDATPYLPEDLNLSIVDGNLDTRLAFNVAKSGETLNGNFRGMVGVRSFNSLDANDEELLKWESLQLDNIKGVLNPFSLDISDVSLSRFFSHIVVSKNGKLNLQELKKSETKTEPEKTQTAAVPPPPAQTQIPGKQAQAPQPKKGLIKIGDVTLQDGVIAFEDHHTKPEYSSKMVNLGGRVSGLSSEINTLADVDLRGNLENHSPLRITGKINPLRDDLFVDLKVSFTDIELSPLTPYSGTYLGYTVDKGKLFLDLKYHIENKNLDSSNNVFIDQLTFGNKVESDKATSLPVRLAVALLKDRKGEIHLDLPVTGRIDDPQFSVWGVVWKILKNLLVKAATAPFALLQSIFGGKEDFSNVVFTYGSAKIPDNEKAKLAKLSQALADRPGLKVEVNGFVDQERDPEGYRNELLAKKIRNEKFLAQLKGKQAKEGESADNIEVLPQEYSQYLKAVYKKEKFPKPRNFIGMLKDIPDDEMKKLILSHTVVGKEDLQNLATARTVAVRDYLINEGKLPAERVFEKKGDIFKAPDKKGETGARVEFGAAAQ